MKEDQVKDEATLLRIRTGECDDEGLKNWHMRVEEDNDSFTDRLLMQISDLQWHPYYHARINNYIDNWAEKRDLFVSESKKFNISHGN